MLFGSCLVLRLKEGVGLIATVAAGFNIPSLEAKYKS